MQLFPISHSTGNDSSGTEAACGAAAEKMKSAAQTAASRGRVFTPAPYQIRSAKETASQATLKGLRRGEALAFCDAYRAPPRSFKVARWRFVRIVRGLESMSAGGSDISDSGIAYP